MEFHHPIVAAPMAGGPSSTALARAVASTGALGFLGGGNKTAQQLTEDYRAVADAGSVGVNLFVPDVANTAVDPLKSQEQRTERLAAFREKLLPFADRLEVEIPTVEQAGADVSDDWDAKLEAAAEWPIVSFTFGLPTPEVFARLHDSGTQVGVTVTSVAEARNAVDHGADFLVVQGPEAGGHRSVHDPLADPGHAGTSRCGLRGGRYSTGRSRWDRHPGTRPRGPVARGCCSHGWDGITARRKLEPIPSTAKCCKTTAPESPRPRVCTPGGYRVRSSMSSWP